MGEQGHEWCLAVLLKPPLSTSSPLRHCCGTLTTQRPRLENHWFSQYYEVKKSSGTRNGLFFYQESFPWVINSCWIFLYYFHPLLFSGAGYILITSQLLEVAPNWSTRSYPEIPTLLRVVGAQVIGDPWWTALVSHLHSFVLRAQFSVLSMVSFCSGWPSPVTLSLLSFPFSLPKRNCFGKPQHAFGSPLPTISSTRSHGSEASGPEF